MTWPVSRIVRFPVAAFIRVHLRSSAVTASRLVRFALLALFVLALARSVPPPGSDRFVPPGMHRIEVQVVDAESGEPLAARVQFTDEDGAYYPPMGYPRKIPQRDYGGSLALPNGENYAYVDGRFHLEAPAGSLTVKASRGLEYDVFESSFDPAELPEGKFTIRLERWADLEAEGWYPGDTHSHFPDPAATLLEMKGEGLSVANPLVYKSGPGDGERPAEGSFRNREHFRGGLSPLSEKRHLLYVNEEFRNHFLGHLIFLNLKDLVWPVSTGGPPENGWGGLDLPTHAGAAEEARRQGALVIWAHFPYPNGECPVDVALGKIDAFDLLTTGSPFEVHPTLKRIYRMNGPRIYETSPLDIYYAYLNCGFRVAASAGSDKMSATVPMGSARVYAQSEDGLSYKNWIEGVRRGRTFITTGPLIEISVDGKGPGAEIGLPAGYKVPVQARARSRMPYEKLELIHNGEVIAVAEPSGERFEAEIAAEVSAGHSGWLAARCWSREMLPYGGPPGHWFRMPVFAHTSPVYLEVEGRPQPAGDAPELFLDQIAGLEHYIRHRGNYPGPEARQRALDQAAQAREIYQNLPR